jgi:mono/diheme cytochrome c family protein
MLLRRLLPVFLIAAASFVVAACGSEGNSVSGQSAAVQSGSKLFAERCSGCHTLSAVGAEGSAANISSAERTNGPNFNTRKECYENVIYAIQNGGFSGAIMPANIVVGKESEQVAAFLAKYAGSEAMSDTGSTAKCAPVPANAGE